jgi:hypothetical protein
MDRLFAVVDPEIEFLAAHNITLLFENTPAHGTGELGSEIADFDALFEHYGPVLIKAFDGQGIFVAPLEL